MARRKLVIATSRYFDTDLHAASGLVPVGHTVGAPRYGSPDAGNVGILAPHGIDRDLSEPAFELLYIARLERFGPEKIRKLLAAIADAYDAPGVVLCCFEDLRKPGQWCHRRMFAGWWFEQTGEHVRELEPAQAALEVG